MAYPQAPEEMPLYLRLPQRYKQKGMTRKSHVLKLKRNVYGQKQAEMWNQYIDQGMKSNGFTPSKFDPCLYYRKSIIFLVYIDDCIVFGPNNKAIDEVVNNLHLSSKNFTLDDQGEVGDFLGIQIQTLDDGSIVLTQPQLIDSIIQDLLLQSGSNHKNTPSITTKLLHKDSDGPDMTPEFHYRSVIGKLNFLEKSMTPDISVSVHQCARYTEHLKRCHSKAVKQIGCYLLGTHDKGLIINPRNPWHFDCWADTDYVGNWRYDNAHVDPMTSKSWSGWVVRFAGAPVTWASKMQTNTALSTTEAEYITLSTILREVIPLMGVLKEASKNGLSIKDPPPPPPPPPQVHCTVFEDNSGALELARLLKTRPRTKHINQAFHHFREHILRQEIIVNATPTDKQMADILTKPLPEAVFVRHRLSIMGW